MGLVTCVLLAVLNAPQGQGPYLVWLITGVAPCVTCVAGREDEAGSLILIADGQVGEHLGPSTCSVTFSSS